MKKTTVNIQHEANINAEGKLNGGNCKPVVCIDTGDVFTSCFDAAESIGVHFSAMSSHLRGKTRTIHGKRYMYLSRVSEGLDTIVTRLRETSAMEEDAKRWREYQAEQEAIRKAEEKRAENIANLEAKLARQREICERIEAELLRATERMMETETELNTLKGNES